MVGRQGSADGKVGVIYRILFPDGTHYIGQSKNIVRRLENYTNLDCKGQKLLYPKLRKYGLSNANVSILLQCSIALLDQEEIRLINDYKSCYRDSPLGLNILKESFETYCRIKHRLPSYKPKRTVRRVVQSTMFGDYMRTWDSAYAIAKATGLKRRDILKATRSKIHYYGGYNWTYEKSS